MNGTQQYISPQSLRQVPRPGYRATGFDTPPSADYNLLAELSHRHVMTDMKRATPLVLSSVLSLGFLTVSGGCSARDNGGNANSRSPEGADDRFLQARLDMVERQIRDRGIKDERVLSAMEKVPRHEFVPEGLQDSAYGDRPLPIGEGQTISQPYIVAFMSEQLQLKPDDKVLEIGTGSGYQAAILAELAKDIYTIEIVHSLADRAQRTLQRQGYSNVHVREGDGYKGWKEHAPFDCIIVTCAPAEVPEPLAEQLKEGGRLVIPVGPDYHQVLYVISKKEGKLVRESTIPVLFVPMTGEAEKQR